VLIGNALPSGSGPSVMVSSLFLSTLLLAAQAVPSTPCAGQGADVAEICSVLMAQQTAWNAGDIPGFMRGYFNSDDLRFASGGSVTKGWRSTLDGYLQRYDAPEAMGRLAFTNVDVTQLSADATYVFGRWTLYREEDEPTGLFTLILNRQTEGWRIIHDHTSSAD